MRVRVFGVCLVIVLTVAACGKNVNTVNAALEPTSVLYPFKPIPIASYEGMGLAKHKDLRIAQEMACSQAHVRPGVEHLRNRDITRQ